MRVCVFTLQVLVIRLLSAGANEAPVAAPVAASVEAAPAEVPTRRRLENEYWKSNPSPTVAQNNRQLAPTGYSRYYPTYSPGEYSSCEMCDTGAFPESPNTQVAIAYFSGTFTCASLWDYGRTGNSTLLYLVHVPLRMIFPTILTDDHFSPL